MVPTDRFVLIIITDQSISGERLFDGLKRSQHSMARLLYTTALGTFLLALWVLFSGKLDMLHLGIGIVTAFGFAFYCAPTTRRHIYPPLRLLHFILWQLLQVLISNMRVARLVLSRKPAIASSLIRIPPGVKSEAAVTILGSAITLTPGTLTVTANTDHLLVHSLDSLSQKEVKQGLIALHIRRIYEKKC